MRSIEAKFRMLEEKNPFLSSYQVFILAVSDQHFSKDRLMRNFNKLVDQDDFDRSWRYMILESVMSANG